MQMKALRSANFAKLSSSSSTRDVYCDTSISAGTPAGYCLSQMRSMVLPLWFGSPFVGPGRLVWGSIEQWGSRWQAAARSGPVVDREGGAGSDRPKPGLTAGRGGGLLLRRLSLGGTLGLDRRFCSGLGLCRLRGGLIAGGDRLFAGFWGSRRLGIRVSDGSRLCGGVRIGLGPPLWPSGVPLPPLGAFCPTPPLLFPRRPGLLSGAPRPRR